MSRKEELGLYGQSKLLGILDRYRYLAASSREAMHNKGALRGVQPNQQEYLLAMLVAAKADQLRMWPEIVALLEQAAIKDWSEPVVLVPDNGEPKGFKLHTFGSFEALYAELVEPWLGPWAELRQTYARFQAGEISEGQGAKEIQARVAAAAARTDPTEVLPKGRQKNAPGENSSRNNLTQARRARANGVSKMTQRRLDAIARKQPDLLQRIAAGELTVREAARKAGVERRPDAGKQLDRWWAEASEEQRRSFLARIGAVIVNHDTGGAA